MHGCRGVELRISLTFVSWRPISGQFRGGWGLDPQLDGFCERKRIPSFDSWMITVGVPPWRNGNPLRIHISLLVGFNASSRSNFPSNWVLKKFTIVHVFIILIYIYIYQSYGIALNPFFGGKRSTNFFGNLQEPMMEVTTFFRPYLVARFPENLDIWWDMVAPRIDSWSSLVHSNHWLVVTGCHLLFSQKKLGFRSSSQLTKSYFSEGWRTTTNRIWGNDL